MVRISLKEAYDDRSVIKKIADLEVSKQDKLTAGQGVSIDNNVINVDTSSLATKAALSAESARLDQKIDKVDAKIPPLASKAELTDEVARLDARVDASNVKIKTNADAILTIEAELGSDALPGTIYYRIAKVENDVITLKPLVNDSIKKVDVEGDASTVYHRALHNSGIVENDALPVASDTKAGVMSAGMYIGFNSSIQNLQARMAVVEGVGITYQLTGLPDNATSEQITAAFREQYPNVPLMAGIRAVDYDKAKIWQYSGTSWIQLTNINIDKATSTALGVVKGSETSTTNEGKIFVEVDGSMTVIGWDTLKALATAAKQSVDNLEPRVTQQSAKIDALEGDVAANAADITALQGTSTNHESRISALESDMNNVKPRVGQLESDVGTLETKVDQHTQSISGLSTDVNGLKTSKQDKLTAGDGITIDQNVISSTSTPCRRVIEGYEAMSNELENFLANARPGSTFEIYQRIHRTDTNYDDWITVPTVDSVYRFGTLSVCGVEWKPRTPITMLSEYSYTDQSGNEFLAKTFAFYGYAYWREESSSTKSKVGWIYFTRIQENSSNIFTVTIDPFGYSDSSATLTRFHNGALNRNVTNPADFEKYFAIVNY